jgi:uncharacterized protein
MTVEFADRPSAAVPSMLLDAMVRHFDPVRVILYGSRARGGAGPDSDWDVMVIVDYDLPPEQRTVRAAFETITGTRIAADVAPVRASKFEDRREVVNSLPWSGANKGLVVYERAKQRQGA